MLKHDPSPPDDSRKAQPDNGRAEKDYPWIVTFEQQPAKTGKADQSDRADCRADRIDGGCLHASPCSVESSFSFFVDLVFLHERRAGRKDGRECEEQTARARSKAMRDQTRGGSDHSAEQKSQRVFMRLSTPQVRRVNRRDQCHTRYAPNATIVQTSSEEVEASRAEVL